MLPNDHPLAYQQPQQGGWGDSEILGNRGGTLSRLVLAHDFGYCFRTESSLKSVDLEGCRLLSRYEAALFGG